MKLQGKNLILAITVPAVVLLDQLIKLLVAAQLQPLVGAASPNDRFVTVIDGFFRLKYAENPGAAWGLLRNASEGFRVPFFVVISILAIVFILYIFRKIEHRQKILAVAVSLILGGALGNLIDRVRMNKVIDFIDWYVSFDEPTNLGLFTIQAGEKHWPTFNIADAAITVGVILLLIDMIRSRKRKTSKQPTDSK